MDVVKQSFVDSKGHTGLRETLKNWLLPPEAKSADWQTDSQITMVHKYNNELWYKTKNEQRGEEVSQGI